MVPRRIVNWFNNGKAEEFLQFSVAKSGKNGLAQFAATENHLVRTPGGWRQAGELIPGNRVMVTEQQRLGDQQVQLILGSLMGDGSLSPNRRGRSGTRFRMGHGAKQAAYLDWKVSLLENIPHSRTVNAKGAVFADFTPLPELGELHEAVYFGDGKKHLSWDYLKSLTPLALAVWYMDDGSFTVRSKGVQERTAGGTGRIEICVEAMSPGSRDRLASYLRDTHGLEVKLISRGARQMSVLQFSTAASAKFQKLIAPYVHPSMEYKLLPRFRGEFGVQQEFVPPTPRLVPARILDIHVKPPTRSMNRFDIEVEGSHNYFVDGVMVHNSPETTSGGKALKFYASVRLDVRRIETLKDGTDAVGNRTRVKVVKNKMAPPFQAQNSIFFTESGSAAKAALSTWAWSKGSCASRVPGTPTRATSSARARRTPATSCGTTRTWPTRSRSGSRRSSASARASTPTPGRQPPATPATARSTNGQPGRQRRLAVPDRRRRGAYCPGCHGLARDPQRPGFRVRGRNVRGHSQRHSGP